MSQPQKGDKDAIPIPPPPPLDRGLEQQPRKRQRNKLGDRETAKEFSQDGRRQEHESRGQRPGTAPGPRRNHEYRQGGEDQDRANSSTAGAEYQTEKTAQGRAQR